MTVSAPSVRACTETLRDYVESADYAGYDPYDALNSPLIRLVGGTSKWVRLAATQAMRRCPVNVRPLLGVRKGHNPKAVGLFLWGYAKLFAIERKRAYLDRIDHLLGLLEQLKSAGYSGSCWGYNFDWQSRSVLRPKWTPTIVNTAFIGHALLDCFEVTGSQRALDLAATIPDFILNDLNRTSSGGAFCFSYTPLDNETVHNANLLGASILLRLANQRRDGDITGPAMTSMAYTMRRQRADGSWSYGDGPYQAWIDSFHTGFNLQAIRYIMRDGYGREYARAYRRGVGYYADNFFLADGTPKYYDTCVYPIDIHAPAQAIYFLSGEGGRYRDLVNRVLTWTLDHMYDGRSFYFRKGRFLTNRIIYMRWSQAWLFHALTEYLKNFEGSNGDGVPGTA